MNKWETILTFTYPHEAHMAKSYLESNRIEVMIKDEMTAQVYNFYSNAIGGVKLQVKKSDFEAGLKILQNGGYINTDELSRQSKIEVIKIDRPANKNFCPFCKSENVVKKRDPNILVLIVYFILGVIFPIFKSGYQCYDCGKAWKYEKIKTPSHNL